MKLKKAVKILKTKFNIQVPENWNKKQKKKVIKKLVTEFN